MEKAFKDADFWLNDETENERGSPEEEEEGEGREEDCWPQ